MPDLATALRSGRIVLMDGAMGTELQRAGIGTGECYEAWNLTRPEVVRGIHRAYVVAGAEVLVANTFQANPLGLARHHLDHSLADITPRSDVVREDRKFEIHVFSSYWNKITIR